MKFFFCRGQFLKLSFARSLFKVSDTPARAVELFCSLFLIFMFFSLVWVSSLCDRWVGRVNKKIAFLLSLRLRSRKRGEKVWSTLFPCPTVNNWEWRERLDVLFVWRITIFFFTASPTTLQSTKQTIERTQERNTRGERMRLFLEQQWMHVRIVQTRRCLWSTGTMRRLHGYAPHCSFPTTHNENEGLGRCKRWPCVVLW